MIKSVLKYDTNDNVFTALQDVEPGDRLFLDKVDTGIIAKDSVPSGHKIACKFIKQGSYVIKINHNIGTAKTDIPDGGYVHIHNVIDLVGDWKNQYKHPYDPNELKEIDNKFFIDNPPKLYGYRRSDGLVGFRNHVVVISTCTCANQMVQDIGAKYKDVIAITNPTGCVILPNETQHMIDLLIGLANNPNVGAVVFYGLGCENVEAEFLYEKVKNKKLAAFARAQTEGSSSAAFAVMEKAVLEMREELAEQKREEVSIADIRLASKCGGSDWTTTAVANPSIGYASDLVVKNGGISLLGETVGWFGGEQILVNRSRTKEIADKIVKMLTTYYDNALIYGRRIEEANPSPGNFAGGITTLNEKALGNVKKGGTAPVEGVLEVGEYPDKNGFYVTNNGSFDPISVLGLTASSANIILFSTGRGTPLGTPLAPVIKLTGSPTASKTFGAHIDVNLTPVIMGEMTIEEAGWTLFKEIIEVANGKLTIAEKLGHREYAFPMLMGSL